MSSELGSGHFSVFPVMTGFKSRVAKEARSAGAAGAKSVEGSFKGAGTRSGRTLGRDMKSAMSSAAGDLGAAEMKNLTGNIASASSALARARLKQQDDAGKVRVAETKLAEAVAKYGPASSQAIAAEERLASARRQHETTTRAVSAASDRLTDAQGRLRSAQDAAAGASARAEGGLKGLLNAAGKVPSKLLDSFASGLKSLPGRAASAFQSVVSAAGRAASAVGRALGDGIKVAATTGVTIAAAGIGVAFTKGIGRLTAIDTARAKLTGLGNDGKTVKTVMGDALASVKGTAFGLGEAATVAAGAMAAQIKPGKNLQAHLKNIANNAAAAGVSMDEMGAIFNKAATQANGVQNDVIGQLADKGIPIYQELAKVLGVTSGEVFKMASQGKIDFETFSKAATAAAGTVAEEMGKTVPGAAKNFMASLGRIGANALEGIYGKIAPLLQAATSALGPIEDRAKQFGDMLVKTVGPALDWITNLLNRVGDGGLLAATGLGGMSGLLAPVAAGLAALGGGGLAGLLTKLPLVGGMLGGLAGPLAALGGPLGIAAAALAGFALSGGDVESLVSGITTVVQKVVAALPGMVQQVASFVPQLVSSILGQVPKLLSAGVQIVTVLIQGIVTAIPTIARGAVELIRGLVSAITSNLPMIISGALALVNALLGGLVSAMPALISGALMLVQGLVQGIVTAVPLLVQGALALITGLVSSLTANLPKIIDGALSIVTALVQGLVSALPLLIGAAVTLVTALIGGLVKMLPQIIQGGLTLLTGILTAVIKAIPLIVNGLLQLLPKLLSTLLGMLPKLLSTGIELFTGLVQAVVKIVPQLLSTLLGLLPKILQTIIGMLPKLLDTGIKLFIQLVQAVVEVLPKLITSIIGMLPKIISTVIGMLPKLLTAAVQLFMALVSALPKILPELVKAIIDMTPKLVGAVIKMIPELLNAGKDLIRGLIDGIVSMGQAVFKAIGDIVNGAIGWAKDLLGIASPSKVFAAIGKNVGQGFVKGVLGTRDQVASAMSALVDKVKSSFSKATEEREKAENKLTDLEKKRAKIQTKINDAKSMKDSAARARRLRDLRAQRNEIDSQISSQQKLVKQYSTVINGGKTQKKLLADIKAANTKLKALAKDREKVTAQLEAATSKLEDLRADRRGVIAGIRDAVVGRGDISAAASATDMITNLRKQIEATTKFEETLKRLKDLGLDDASRDQLVEQFKSSGSAAGAEALLAGGSDAVSTVAKLQAKLAKAGQQLGTTVGDDMYLAGIQAQKGLVAGLESDLAAIDKAAKKIADALTSGIKKALKIQSPSRVTRELGEFTGEGLALGMEDKVRRVQAAADRMLPRLQAPTAAAPVGVAGASSVAGAAAGGVTIMGDVYTRDENELVRKLDRSRRAAYFAQNAFVKVG